MKRSIIAATLIAVVVINLANLVTGFRYAPYTSVGSKDVAVYEPSAGDSDLVPIKKLPDFVSTGKEVLVYMRSGYLESDRLNYALLSLVVVGLGGFAYALAAAVERKEKSTRS